MNQLGQYFDTLIRYLSITLLVAFSAAGSAENLDSDASYDVAGLQHPAEIIVDEWGVPHIYANDHYDVFFVQGFNAARDRLWQLDIWRKRGLGQLAQSFGPSYIKQDTATRLFLYRKDMYSEWLAYGNDAKRIAQAFAAGINAFINITQKHKNLLPPEFGLLDYTPDYWHADDIVRIRSNGLWRNVIQEVWRAQLACNGQLKLAARWKQLEPTWETKVPAGLDPCLVTEDVLDMYKLAKAPVTFAAAEVGSKKATAISKVVSGQVLALQDEFDHTLGSNNWVVAADRTNTGRPILADDPHRGHATPSLRYIAHLNGPGINVIGAGEPALPGISIGHNERIAFGLTIFPIDQEDLYVYEKRDTGYLYKGRTEPFILVNESIKVRNAPEHSVQLKFTRHGPVVAETPTHAFVVVAAWLEPGMSPYFGSIEYMRAQNYREFVSALNRWGAPSENQVYADIDGNIAYKPAGRFPIRPNWDGLLPVPGDGRYEWQGYFDMDVLPEEYNPKRGYTGTANSMNLPDDYPIDKYKIGFEWSSPWRYRRLWEYLADSSTHTMEHSLALQRDYESVLARELLSSLSELPADSGGKLLQQWDHRLSVDSPAAALWNVWYSRHLTPSLAQHLTAGQNQSPGGQIDSLTVLELLKTDPGKEIANSTLLDAWQETTQLLGENPKQWRWGDLHQIRFEHPLLFMAPEALQKDMKMPAYPRGGSGNTTNNTSYRANDFLVRAGASFRMVVDVGNWDAALATNAPGQSGDPRSRFYDNLLENWATESQFPLLFSKTAIEKHKAFTITLNPLK